jgi:O-antigen ligase
MITENEIFSLGRNRNFVLLGLFALATLIIFDIGSVSLSFIFGAALIILSLKDFKTFFVPHGICILLVVFVVIAYIATLFAELTPTKTTVLGVIRLFYWLLLAIFVYNSYPSIDKFKLSRVIFISVTVVLILDVFWLTLSQNAIAFTAIIMGPLGYYYLRRFSFRLIYSGMLIYLMLLNGSRTGAVLSLIQSILFLILFLPIFKNNIKILVTVMILITLGVFFTPVRGFIGNKISPLNKEAGELLLNPEDVFRNDLSWLQRRAQVNKGYQIFKEHPVFGIGLFNFPRYNIRIDISNIKTDRRTIKGIDNRSAHNAYIDLITETGITGFAVIIVMLLISLVRFIKKLARLPDTFEGSLFISFIGLLIYFYVISGFYGTSTWIIIGLILGASDYLRSKSVDL